MKKLLLGLFGIIFGLINFSSASFTAVINNQPIQQWNNTDVSAIYNQYGEGFLCITSLNQGYSVIFYDNYWNILNSIQITNNNGGTACVLVDSSIAFFNNNGGGAYFNYYIAGQSSCPSESELCPNIRLRIINSIHDAYGTGLQLTNYANGNILNSDIYYSGNLQFSQSNGSLLMTCPSSDCSYYENELNMCLNDYDLLGQDYDNLQSSYNSLSGSLSSCESELNICTPALSQCLSGGGSDLTGLNWSALFINDIQHLGSAVINITIPEEIAWDYSGDLEEFNLDVIGYNVDSDYIQSVIDINSYRPTSEEFTDVFVSGLTFIFPYIVITLFIVFIRKLLKKIFK